ncbi:fasciclin domain-containing protein [Cellulophaga lytica]|uniref:Beta-Ig-H3/fasciclin n=1 Tax=Cellulophaga lytica (strain ATCC 23178 / DSM 7489 / JCM 8516 / NBRC 14961 / NCIMB 1423 / VKM B-1433 / Cy l20) TaxID=867900 RepID=F0R9P7_CELLC|nr:fasciclin domain-containing protein [Cellulophaga lytica]ADY29379.1 beta-Ig-H3/fasciclin [Cellulophaga lytica DSM 7489]WQG76446.1 fasciclin domain-containing protein [Cellulophaga lytica]
MKLSKVLKSTLLAATLLIGANTFAQDKMMKAETKMVGGAEMYPTKDIITNAVNSKDHTTLVAAVKAADLVKTLQGEGPFTVFAPTNMAFEKLPKGTVETLLMTENKATLQKVLTYHVVAGKYSAKDIIKAIKIGKGKAEFTTVADEKLTAMVTNGKVQLKDVAGNISTVTIADVNQSNGVIHVVDTVILPMK